jgi:hypothetical protein
VRSIHVAPTGSATRAFKSKRARRMWPRLQTLGRSRNRRGRPPRGEDESSRRAGRTGGRDPSPRDTSSRRCQPMVPQSCTRRS